VGRLRDAAATADDGADGLLDAYVVVDQHDDAACGGATALDVELAERHRAP
jgi:hypothetical protein